MASHLPRRRIQILNSASRRKNERRRGRTRRGRWRGRGKRRIRRKAHGRTEWVGLDGTEGSWERCGKSCELWVESCGLGVVSGELWVASCE